MRKLKQSTACALMLFMTDAADHIAGKTGLTLTITASKAGAAFAAITPTVTERGSGWYSLALTTAHTDTLGDLALHVTAASADPTDVLCQIVAGSLDADVSSRLATAGYTAPPTAAAVRTEIDANSTKLDAAISTRLATAGYTAPNNAGIASILAAVDTEIAAILAAVDTEVAAIKARTDNLPADTAAALTAISGYVDEIESRLTAGRAALLDNLDAAISTRLAEAGYTAPPSAATNAAAVAATFAATPPPVDLVKVKGQQIDGAGTEMDPWGPV
jgi:hypothetical protein